jgi:hypothetical protein
MREGETTSAAVEPGCGVGEVKGVVDDELTGGDCSKRLGSSLFGAGDVIKGSLDESAIVNDIDEDSTGGGGYETKKE